MNEFADRLWEKEGRRIWTLNRARACKFKAERPYAVVSLIDPILDQPTLAEDPNRTAHLILKFWDTEDDTVYPGISGAQCNQVALFAQKKVLSFTQMDLMVHCEAGVSRSSGCAAAFGKYLSNDDRYWYGQTGAFIPNRRVYTGVLSALMHLCGAPRWWLSKQKRRS